MERQRIARPWDEYPIGTKAHASEGGYWEKIDRGWKWCNSNCAFPTPGGSATSVTLPYIMHDDPEAARFVENISGWVSGDGFFFGKEEDAARYRGCTHKKCECGNLMEKHYLRCDACIEKRDIEKYAKLDLVAWDADGKTPVYSDVMDKYYWDWEDIENDCDEFGMDVRGIRLKNCTPIHMSQIDPDHWADDFHDEWDGELPPLVKEALDALNDAISKSEPSSWCVGSRAIIIPGGAE